LGPKENQEKQRDGGKGQKNQENLEEDADKGLY
jgi:hypothetical protein